MTDNLRASVAAIDWAAVARSLEERGFAVTAPILSAGRCRALAAEWDNETSFRATIQMERFNFGRGEYRYFRYPLPAAVQALREEFYRWLAGPANRWSERLGLRARYPAALGDFLRLCRAKNQSRPTPLVLKYGAGDFNCLHQDLYGELYFPFQVTLGLSRPGADYVGGELVLVKQRPRMQSVPHVIALEQGQAAIFAVNFHPERGKRGYLRATLRHGVSALAEGRRFTLGIIFHDAR